MMKTQTALAGFLAVAMILMCTGCVRGPRTFHASIRDLDRTDGSADLNDEKRPTPGIEVVQGNPSKVVDSIGWVVGIPRRVVLWDRRVDNHDVQPETMANTQDTLDYLQTHGTYEEQREGVAILDPNYGASVGGAFGSLFGISGIFEIGGAMVGHVSGWHKASQVDWHDIDTVQIQDDAFQRNKSLNQDRRDEMLMVGNSM